MIRSRGAFSFASMPTQPTRTDGLETAGMVEMDQAGTRARRRLADAGQVGHAGAGMRRHRNMRKGLRNGGGVRRYAAMAPTPPGGWRKPAAALSATMAARPMGRLASASVTWFCPTGQPTPAGCSALAARRAHRGAHDGKAGRAGHGDPDGSVAAGVEAACLCIMGGIAACGGPIDRGVDCVKRWP